MKKFILFCLLFIVFFSCSSDKINFSGKAYSFQEGNDYQIIAFTDDIIYFEWKDSFGTDKFTTSYNLKKENDTLFTIILQDSLKYLDSKKFQIVIEKDGGFYSLKSNKRYKPKKD